MTGTNMYESCSSETQFGTALAEGLEAVRNSPHEQCGRNSIDNPGNGFCPQRTPQAAKATGKLPLPRWTHKWVSFEQRS